MGRKKIKRFLTVYTASSTERGPKGIDHHVVSGSFLCRGDAIRECARDIMFTVGSRPAMRSLFVQDERVRKALKDGGMTDDMIDNLADDATMDEDAIMDKAASNLKDLLVDVIGGDGCMTFGSDMEEFRFDVDENDVVCDDGLQLWTCITSGRDDEGHDPDFEQAYPEIFLDEEDAVRCAIDDLVQCLDGYEDDEKRTILAEARERLSEHGHFEFDLNDTRQRRWDVWFTPLGLGQGSGMVKRR